MRANLLTKLKNRKAKMGLVVAADNLHKAALTAGPTPEGVMYVFDTIRQDVISAINSVNGKNVGPAQNARAIVDDYLHLALQEDYRFDDSEVVSAFAYFLLAVVTEGFENEDTTGTQMGNFKGSWRGGGFE